MEILITGPISFIGGVNVHILRLVRLLSNQKINFNFVLIDESPLSYAKKNVINIRRVKDSLKFLYAISKSDIIHIHSGNWLIRIFYMLCALILRKPFIVTLHSLRITGLKKTCTLLLLRKANKVIVVNQEIKAIVQSKRVLTDIKEAFIPPILEDEIKLPIEIEDRLLIEKKDKTLICANAFRLITYKGRELYGLDQCIEVAYKAKQENLDILIIFVIGTVPKKDDLYTSMINMVEQNALASYIWIIPYQVSFINLMIHSSIVLRPTLTDGDALTIREALYLKKIVIASDIVKRPAGTFLYKTGQSSDLYYKIVKHMNNNIEKSESQSDDLKMYFEFYCKLYLSCYNSHKS